MKKHESERDLIVRLKDGDTVAFKKLYTFYGKKINYVCHSFRLSAEDTEEIIQDVFYRVWKRKEYLDPDLSFNAYIEKIARNLVLNHLRKITQTQKIANNCEKRQFTDSLLDSIISNDLEAQAQDFINELPTQRRQIFLMAKIQHMSNAEIADQMSLSPRTIENQLYRAIKFLREKIKVLQSEVQVLLLLGMCLLNI